MRNEWIFGNKQLLNLIDDIYVKYYTFIHYKEYDERILYYFVNVKDDIDFIATATLTKKTVNKYNDKIYELCITDNVTKEVYNNDNDNNVYNNNVDEHDDNDVIYEIKDDINIIDTIEFDRLDLMEYYEITGIKKNIQRNAPILFTLKVQKQNH